MSAVGDRRARAVRLADWQGAVSAALARRLAVDRRRGQIVLPDATGGDFADELAARGGAS